MTDTPAAVARTATLSAQLPLNELALLGTLTAPDGAIALMRSGTGRIHRLEPGDAIAGATVAAIEDGRVHVSRGGRARVYEMPQG